MKLNKHMRLTCVKMRSFVSHAHETIAWFDNGVPLE